LEIFVKKEGLELFTVTASLALRGKFLYTEEKGTRPVTVGNMAMDKLHALVSRQVAAERKDYLYSRKYRSHARAENSRNLLEEQARAGSSSSFGATLRDAVPELEPFISREIARRAAFRPILTKGPLFKKNLEDSVYEALYQAFRVSPDEPEKIIIWAYTIASEKIRLMAEEWVAGSEPEFESRLKPAEEVQEEQGDLSNPPAHAVPQEPEPVEKFYGPYHFHLFEILMDAGGSEDLLNKVEPGDEDSTIKLHLESFPEDQQSLFDLYYLHRFRIDEIARIKNMTDGQVDHLLRAVRSVLLQIVKNLEEPVSAVPGGEF
jgi:DNA-directed RNA polymerase specialized sigma24 family protein